MKAGNTLIAKTIDFKVTKDTIFEFIEVYCQMPSLILWMYRTIKIDHGCPSGWPLLDVKSTETLRFRNNFVPNCDQSV